MIRFGKERTEVHCQGDVAVFGCALADDGTAWVVLGDGEQGDIGRDVPDEVAEQMVREGQRVVLVGAQTVESLDVLIEVFGAARDRLATAGMAADAPQLPDDLVAALGKDRAAGAALALKRAELILAEVSSRRAPAQSALTRRAEQASRALAKLLEASERSVEPRQEQRLEILGRGPAPAGSPWKIWVTLGVGGVQEGTLLLSRRLVETLGGEAEAAETALQLARLERALRGTKSANSAKVRRLALAIRDLLPEMLPPGMHPLGKATPLTREQIARGLS